MNDASEVTNAAKTDWNSLRNFPSSDWNEDILQHRKKRTRRKKESAVASKHFW